jgi:hypothetical protein
MNPLTLAQILGHSSLVMIQNVYAHLTPSDAYDALLKAFATDWGRLPSRLSPERARRPLCLESDRRRSPSRG